MGKQLLALACAVLLLTGCQAGAGDGQPAGRAGDASPQPSPSSTLDALVAQVFGRLTESQKIGQLLMIALNHNADPATITGLTAGGQATGVLLLGNGWSLVQTTQVTQALAQAGSPVGLYVAADQEGGKVQRLSGDGFDAIPPATVQGTWTTQQLTAQATIWAQQLRAAGVNLNLAPVTDTVPPSMLAASAAIGVFDRQFGSDPVSVGEHAAAFAQGMAAGGVQTCAKHFPGMGRITGNTDVSTDNTTDDVTTSDDAYVQAFVPPMRVPVAMVMMSWATYTQIDPDNPAGLSPTVIDGVLRGQLGWSGVVISDSMDAGAVKALTPAQQAVAFVRAGGDIAIFTTADTLRAAAAGLSQQMSDDPAFAAMVDASVQRVLRAKAEAGLLA